MLSTILLSIACLGTTLFAYHQNQQINTLKHDLEIHDPLIIPERFIEPLWDETDPRRRVQSDPTDLVPASHLQRTSLTTVFLPFVLQIFQPHIATLPDKISSLVPEHGLLRELELIVQGHIVAANGGTKKSRKDIIHELIQAIESSTPTFDISKRGTDADPADDGSDATMLAVMEWKLAKALGITGIVDLSGYMLGNVSFVVDSPMVNARLSLPERLNLSQRPEMVGTSHAALSFKIDNNLPRDDTYTGNAVIPEDQSYIGERQSKMYSLFVTYLAQYAISVSGFLPNTTEVPIMKSEQPQPEFVSAHESDRSESYEDEFYSFVDDSNDVVATRYEVVANIGKLAKGRLDSPGMRLLIDNRSRYVLDFVGNVMNGLSLTTDIYLNDATKIKAQVHHPQVTGQVFLSFHETHPWVRYEVNAVPKLEIDTWINQEDSTPGPAGSMSWPTVEPPSTEDMLFGDWTDFLTQAQQSFFRSDLAQIQILNGIVKEKMKSATTMQASLGGYQFSLTMNESQALERFSWGGLGEAAKDAMFQLSLCSMVVNQGNLETGESASTSFITYVNWSPEDPLKIPLFLEGHGYEVDLTVSLLKLQGILKVTFNENDLSETPDAKFLTNPDIQFGLEARQRTSSVFGTAFVAMVKSVNLMTPFLMRLAAPYIMVSTEKQEEFSNHANQCTSSYMR